jgi:hypothetical protein
MATYALAGSGIQALNPSSMLTVSVTTFGSRMQTGDANPVNYYHLALLTPGDANGFFAPLPVVENPQSIILPNGATRLGYACVAGTTLSVTEVAAAAASNKGLPYWDRNFTNFILNYDQPDVSPQAQLQVFSHTVTAGKIGLILDASAEVVKTTAPTTSNVTAAWFTLNGAIFLDVQQFGAYVGYPFSDDTSGAAVPLHAGDVVSGYILSNDVGGVVRYTMSAVIVEFDP